jgi:hypothetical protein
MKASVAFLVSVLACGEAVAQAPTQQNNTSNINPRIRNTVNPATNSNATGGAGGAGGAANPTSNARGGAASANPNASSGASSGSSSVEVTTGSQNNIYPATQSILSVPMVYTPSISTGNVCALGASAGASWLGAGFAVGTSWESMQCERRQTAALLYNMGTAESRAAAKEVLCASPEIRNAYLTIGHPCAADMMQVAGAAGRTVKPPPPPPEPPAFNPGLYRSAADCLTAAQAAGAALSLCAGKR